MCLLDTGGASFYYTLLKQISNICLPSIQIHSNNNQRYLNKLQHIDDRCRDFYSRSVGLDEHSLRSFLRNINHDSTWWKEEKVIERKENKYAVHN